MPMYEYLCQNDHVSEVLYRSFQDAENKEVIPCKTCGESAERIVSVPLPAHLYGGGWYKPSPTMRDSYKRVHKDERGNKFSGG